MTWPELLSDMKGTSLKQKILIRKRKTKKQKIFAVLFAILLIFAILPYLIPVSKADGSLTFYPYEDSHFSEIDSVLLHYRLQVPANGQIKGRVILIHGLGGSTYSFNQNVSSLVGSGYVVLSVDLPGFGYSSRRTDFDHSQISRGKLLWKLIEHVEDSGEIKTDNIRKNAADESWFLAGHSMGGGTAAAMAYLNPGKTKSVILLDGALLDTNQAPTWLFYIPPFDRYVQVIVEKFLITENNMKKFLTSAYGREPGKEALKKYSEPLLLPGTGRSALGLLKTSENIPLGMYEGLEVPFYGIWGREDAWVPFEQTQQIDKYIADFEAICIEGARHCPMETHSEEFNQILIAYLVSFE